MYFVIDYIDDKSFDEYIKEGVRKISVEAVENIWISMMDFLNIVHSEVIVYCDVTPDNICLTNDGMVKLLGFGTVRYRLGDKSRSLDVILNTALLRRSNTMHTKHNLFAEDET